jgi:WD40 repeat protein
MVLGELTYQRMSGDLRFVHDPELVAYVKNIGEKLVKHLPPTGLKYKFLIIDIPEANAFNIPGGYVFVSRKLIGFANNEDELAGVLAHELGHAVVRHAATDFSELLKRILNVTTVGDRKDVAEKYNLVIERRRTKTASRGAGHESIQQLEADKIGLFAMVAAGYDPNSFASFFGRLVESKAKGGGWFSDIFSKPKPEEKRLAEMIKATEQFPTACRDKRNVSASEEFLKWQADIVSSRDTNRKEELPALLWKKELSPKLRSDITHFAISPDGKYFLAQDDFAITVIQRKPLMVAFQIPVPDAKEASFTPDGQFVVFGTENLRYEKWSVAEKKPVEVRELVVRRDCLEHEFSPDGKYLACIDNAINLNLVETQTGKRIWEKKEFYRLTIFEYLIWLGVQARSDERDRYNRFFHIEFSPDSRFMAVSRSNKARFVFKVDAIVMDESENTLLALDLTSLKNLNIGGELKKVTRRSFVFLDAKRVLGMSSSKAEDSGVFSFPEGKRLARFTLGADELKATGNPNYIIIKPLANAKLGVFDISRNALVGAMNKVDLALWNDLMLFEGVSGKVLISEAQYDEGTKMLKGKPLESIEIPVSAIGELDAAEVSDNFQWLAVSSQTRGAVWELNSGERKMFVRGFRGALMGNDGGAIGDFPKLEPANHTLALLNPMNNSTSAFREIPDKGARQHGRFVLIRQSLKNLGKDGKASESTDASLTREVRIELRDIISDKVIWTGDYPKDAPGIFVDEFSGRLIFYWELSSDLGKARLKEDAALAARSREMGNKDDDYLLEVFDAFAAKSLGTVLLETGKGSFDIEAGHSEGNWLVLHDSGNRILAFTINDGSLRHRFFGAHVSINPAKSQIVVENYPGELTMYDLSTGDSLARLVFRHGAAFVRFSLDGKKLFVLSNDQVAHAFDVEKLQSQLVPLTQ